MNQQIAKFNNQNYTVLVRDDVDQSVLNEITKFQEYRAAKEVIVNTKDPVLDIGAHAGFFTLFSRSLNPLVPIIAIEPEPNNLSALGTNLNANSIAGVEVINGVLSAHAGPRTLYLAPDSHNHSVFAISKKSINVAGFTLRTIIEKYDVARFSLVKMDIEGGEYELLNAWEDFEYSKISNLMIEYHSDKNHNPKELEAVIRQHGFGVRQFPSKFDNTMGFFFANNKRVK